VSPPSIPNRREFLTSLGAATATTIAGCLDSTPASETTDEGSVTTTERLSPAETDAQGTSDTEAASNNGSPTAATPSDPPRSGPDPFYVENHRPEDRCVSLSIRHDESDEVALDGTYTVPAAKGIAVEAVGVVGESYAVEATLDSGGRVTDDWEVGVCPPEFRGDGLNHAGLLRIDDDVKFVTNECDFLVVDRPETYEWDPDESDCEV
jgi:hypothetical protein